MAPRLSKSMREVGKYRSLLNRGITVAESEDPIAIANLAAEVMAIKWHNPFWVGIVSLALGNILRKSAFSLVRRLGWSMMGYGGATTAAEGIGWAVNVAQQIKDIKTQWTGNGTPEPEPSGGIGEP